MSCRPLVLFSYVDQIFACFGQYLLIFAFDLQENGLNLLLWTNFQHFAMFRLIFFEFKDWSKPNVFVIVLM